MYLLKFNIHIVNSLLMLFISILFRPFPMGGGEAYLVAGLIVSNIILLNNQICLKTHDLNFNVLL